MLTVQVPATVTAGQVHAQRYHHESTTQFQPEARPPPAPGIGFPPRPPGITGVTAAAFFCFGQNNSDGRVSLTEARPNINTAVDLVF